MTPSHRLILAGEISPDAGRFIARFLKRALREFGLKAKFEPMRPPTTTGATHSKTRRHTARRMSGRKESV